MDETITRLLRECFLDNDTHKNVMRSVIKLVRSKSRLWFRCLIAIKIRSTFLWQDVTILDIKMTENKWERRREGP